MFVFLKNILVIVFIVGFVFVATNYSGLLKDQIGVKGASTDRAKEISGQMGSDIGAQIDMVKKQVMDVKVSDLVNGLSRAQKIPEDFNKSTDYLKEQIDNVLKSRK